MDKTSGKTIGFCLLVFFMYMVSKYIKAITNIICSVFVLVLLVCGIVLFKKDIIFLGGAYYFKGENVSILKYRQRGTNGIMCLENYGSINSWVIHSKVPSNIMIKQIEYNRNYIIAKGISSENNMESYWVIFKYKFKAYGPLSKFEFNEVCCKEQIEMVQVRTKSGIL